MSACVSFWQSAMMMPLAVALEPPFAWCQGACLGVDLVGKAAHLQRLEDEEVRPLRLGQQEQVGDDAPMRSS